MRQDPQQPGTAEQRARYVQKDGFWRRAAFIIGATILVLIIIASFSHVLALALGSYLVLGAIIVGILALVRMALRGTRTFQPPQPDQTYYQRSPHPQQQNYQPYDQGYQPPYYSPQHTLQDQPQQVPTSNEQYDQPLANYPEPMPPAER